MFCLCAGWLLPVRPLSHVRKEPPAQNVRIFLVRPEAQRLVAGRADPSETSRSVLSAYRFGFGSSPFQVAVSRQRPVGFYSLWQRHDMPILFQRFCGWPPAV